jgi:hypothetical protein
MICTNANYGKWYVYIPSTYNFFGWPLNVLNGHDKHWGHMAGSNYMENLSLSLGQQKINVLSHDLMI